MSRRCTSETWRLSEDTTGAWRAAMHHGQRMAFTAGKALYRQGELSNCFHLVLSGKVEVSMVREDGTEFLIEIMGSGAICGEAAAFDGQPNFSTAVAVEPSVAVCFEVDRLHEAFASQPELVFSLLRVFSIKQRIMSRRAQHLSAADPEVRIGELLARLASTYGAVDGEGILIPFAVTHEQIASMTGTSRVTVTRSLKRLREIGALSIEQGKICIRQPRMLSA